MPRLDTIPVAVRATSLTAALFVFWLGLSGHYSVMLVAAGLVSAVLCTLLAHRLGMLDADGHPLQMLPRALTYVPWLVWEVMKSSWAVTRLVLHPRLPISPTMTRVLASQRTPIGIAVFANSITLTPGTITVGVDGDVLTVHALTEDGAIDLEGGAMDARVARFEGGK